MNPLEPRILVTVYGRGDQTRSFCYVSDLVAALRCFMQTRPELCGPLNLGNPDEHSILELAEKTIALTNSRSMIVFKDLPFDDPVRRRPDIALATAELAWQPKVSLDEGLERTIDYFDELLGVASNVEPGAPARRAG